MRLSQRCYAAFARLHHFFKIARDVARVLESADTKVHEEGSMKFVAVCGLAVALSAAAASPWWGLAGQEPAGHDWPIYGGTTENNHFSSLNQINRSNVQQLQVAWTYDTEESGGLQSSPLIVDGVLYGLTPSEKVFALNAATGQLLWKFDSGIKGTQPDRGLAYWAEEPKP
jgi:glucose dehydrogenase